MPARSEVLTVRQVSVSLSGRSILKDIDFALEAGELCGLIGANGSGKTTLLRTILGFVAPAGGTIA
ncbi:MAG: ABC transporter ATP-binding protein, partial [Acetobacteraceae bacterium]|nr:ABC transporter ATP-binding protein [Acetobacteraceae bacterium]